MTRATRRRLLGVVPFALLVAAWVLAPHVATYPPYVLPSLGTVWSTFTHAVLDGSLSLDSPAGRGTRLRARIPCAAN